MPTIIKRITLIHVHVTSTVVQQNLVYTESHGVSPENHANVWVIKNQ